MTRQDHDTILHVPLSIGNIKRIALLLDNYRQGIPYVPALLTDPISEPSVEVDGNTITDIYQLVGDLWDFVQLEDDPEFLADMFYRHG